jgi:hypothetical protein
MTSRTPGKSRSDSSCHVALFRHTHRVASRYWSPNYIQYSAHTQRARDGLFNLIRDVPATRGYQPGVILADWRQ